MKSCYPHPIPVTVIPFLKECELVAHPVWCVLHIYSDQSVVILM